MDDQETLQDCIRWCQEHSATITFHLYAGVGVRIPAYPVTVLMGTLEEAVMVLQRKHQEFLENEEHQT